MAENNYLQLSLRRAFRFGYYAFLCAIIAALLVVGVWFFGGDVTRLQVYEMSGGKLLAFGGLLFGLSVPLFFGLWSMIGTAVLGIGFRQPTIFDDLHGA